MAFDTTSYDLLKKSKQQEALNKKNNTISALQTQQGGIENAYKDLADTLAKRKADLATKNTMDNQNLDTQLQQGTEKYMNQRDQGVIANTNQSKALMDWYAKNNIANSTASADEMGRQATTLANTLGSINTNKNSFDDGIANNRNLTNLDYSNGVNDLVNQDNAAQREKAQKLAEILNQITGADSTYNSEVQSINDSVEAQKLQDLNNYNQQQEAYQRQLEAQRQQQAASLRAAQAKASASSSAKAATAQKQKDTDAVWNELYANINQRTGEQFLQENRSAIISNLGSKVYQDMLNTAKNYKYSAAENQRYGRNQKDATPQNYYRDMG